MRNLKSKNTLQEQIIKEKNIAEEQIKELENHYKKVLFNAINYEEEAKKHQKYFEAYPNAVGEQKSTYNEPFLYANATTSNISTNQISKNCNSSVGISHTNNVVGWDPFEISCAKKPIINKDEEMIINIEELAQELSEIELKNSENKLEYSELLKKYKNIILKHERRNKS